MRCAPARGLDVCVVDGHSEVRRRNREHRLRDTSHRCLPLRRPMSGCQDDPSVGIAIRNNLSWRELRAIVKRRINRLFLSSDEHADRACAVFSLIASCERHGLDPALYLQKILTVAPSYPVRDILDLSPKNWAATRQRRVAEGSLSYLDLAMLTELELRSR